MTIEFIRRATSADLRILGINLVQMNVVSSEKVEHNVLCIMPHTQTRLHIPDESWRLLLISQNWVEILPPLFRVFTCFCAK